MEIVDFLPKYPDVTPDSLSPYDENFYQSIFRKKELYENRLEERTEFPKQTGWMTKYQTTIARYMSSHTPYDSLLIIHAPGSGKTCSAIASIELIKSENSSINGALILASSELLLRNFQNEIANKCTAGDYLSDLYLTADTDKKKVIRLGKAVSETYSFETFRKLASSFKKNHDIVKKYSNKVIVVDEVHNIRIQTKENPDATETYDLLYEFLHSIKNCKIILMSGTPMKDKVDEISSVMNLMIPREMKLPTGDEFVENFLISKDNVLFVKKSKKEELKNVFKGRISFLKEDFRSDVKKSYIGTEQESSLIGLKHLRVKLIKMSKYQSDAYNKAFTIDNTKEKKGVYPNSINASLFAYPENLPHDEGFLKYISVIDRKDMLEAGTELQSYSSPKLDNIIVGSIETKLKTLERYSSYYATVIRQIFQTKGKCFVFCSVVHGAGAILFACLLQIFGFGSATGWESHNSPSQRYALISSDSYTIKGKAKVMEKFNSPENYDGSLIKVLIGTRVVNEGFSLNNIKMEAILTPHWNYTETFQALARGIRFGSHRILLERDVSFQADPTVKILQMVNIPSDKWRMLFPRPVVENDEIVPIPPEYDPNDKDILSIFAHMYRTAEDKDISIKNMLRLIMESAVDCSLNYMRNHITGFDGQAECEYRACDYKCDGVKMENVIDGLQDDEIDYSTYDLYYLDPKRNKIFEKIEALFRKYESPTLKVIADHLSRDYSKIQIVKALEILTASLTENTPLSYSKFKEIYMTDNRLFSIVSVIEKMFLTRFQTTYSVIKDVVLKNTPLRADIADFTILSALNKIINNQIVIKNKYGIECYLRELNGSFFLIESIETSSMEKNKNISLFLSPLSLSEYYTKNININAQILFSDALSIVSHKVVLKSIDTLCGCEDENDFKKKAEKIDANTQEMIIELCLSYENDSPNKAFIELVKKFYSAFIFETEEAVFSSFLENKNVLRIALRKDNKLLDWKDATTKDKIFLLDKKKKKAQAFKQENPYGLYGLYNPSLTDKPEYKKFCILDYQTKTKTGRSEYDKRVQATGKVCATWSVPDLLNLIIVRLKISPPSSYTNYHPEMIEDIWDRYGFSEENPPSVEDGLRIQYWTQFATKVKLCSAILKFLKDANLADMNNDVCGIQRKIKDVTEQKGAVAKYKLSFLMLTPDEYEERLGQIGVAMDKMYGIKKYEPMRQDGEWSVVMRGKNVVLFICENAGAIVHLALYSDEWKDEEFYKEVMKYAIYMLSESLQNTDVKVLSADKRFDRTRFLLEKLGYSQFKKDDSYSYFHLD